MTCSTQTQNNNNNKQHSLKKDHFKAFLKKILYFSLFFSSISVCTNHRTPSKSCSFVSHHSSRGLRVKCRSWLSFLPLCRGCHGNGNKAIRGKKQQQTNQKKKEHSETNALQTQRALHRKQTTPLISVSLQSRLHRFVNSTGMVGGKERYHGNFQRSRDDRSLQTKVPESRTSESCFGVFFVVFFATLRLCGRSGCVHLGLLRWLFGRRRQRWRRLWWRRLRRRGRRRLLLLGRWGSTRLSDHQ